MARKSKKAFAVEKITGGAEDARWIRQKGQFETQEDAQAYIDDPLTPIDAAKNFRIVKEDRI